MRGRHIHSMFPLGATSAVTSQSERNAYSAIGGNGLPPEGDVAAVRGRFIGRAARPRPQRRPVGRVAQQRLADALAEDPGLAARGAEDGPLARCRRAALR